MTTQEPLPSTKNRKLGLFAQDEQKPDNRGFEKPLPGLTNLNFLWDGRVKIWCKYFESMDPSCLS